MSVVPSARGYQRRLAAVALIFCYCFFLYTQFGSRWRSPSWLKDYSLTPHEESPQALDAETLSPSPTPTRAALYPPSISQEQETAASKPIGTLVVPEIDASKKGVIVIGKTQDEDASWVEELDEWQHAVYSVDNTSASLLHTPMNKGREAMPYLTYMIDHYHNLPRNLVFLHPHKDGYPGGWHTDAPDNSNIWSVQHLNVDFLQREGYVNLRCIHTPGCPDEIQPFRDDKIVDRTAEKAMAAAWTGLFGNNDVPETIGAPCCAQFAVSREQVHMRPLQDYIRFRRWLIESELPDDTTGRVFEYLWHIIFGREPVFCPPLAQCYNDVCGGDQVPPAGYEEPEWATTLELS